MPRLTGLGPADTAVLGAPGRCVQLRTDAVVGPPAFVLIVVRPVRVVRLAVGISRGRKRVVRGGITLLPKSREEQETNV